MVRVTEQHADSQALAKTHQGGGKVTATRTADEADVAVHAHRLGQPVTHEQLSYCLTSVVSA
jgi:hypothetical protein